MKLTDREIFRLAEAGKRNDFTFLRGFFTAMERAHNVPLVKKYYAAINRIESEFETLFRCAAWPPEWHIDVVSEHRLKVVGYLQGSSVKALIDDMRAVDQKNIRPHNLKYFMFTRGAASRWDLLIDAIYEQRWEEKKRAEIAGMKRSSDKSTREIATQFGKTKSMPLREVSLGSLFGTAK